MSEYLYHGTHIPDIAELEPRQAMKAYGPDGKPAVFATENIDYAIFMAVVGSRQMGGWNKTILGGRGFYIQEDSLNSLIDDQAEGYIYFLPRCSFVAKYRGEYRSHKPVKPLDSVSVDAGDLPNDVRVLTTKQMTEFLEIRDLLFKPSLIF